MFKYLVHIIIATWQWKLLIFHVQLEHMVNIHANSMYQTQNQCLYLDWAQLQLSIGNTASYLPLDIYMIHTKLTGKYVY